MFVVFLFFFELELELELVRALLTTEQQAQQQIATIVMATAITMITTITIRAIAQPARPLLDHSPLLILLYDELSIQYDKYSGDLPLMTYA